MDLLAALMLFLSVTGAIALKLLGSELQDWVPVLARSLIDRALAQLPENDRDRYREEWHAHLRDCPGKLMGLWHASSCALGAKRLARELSNNVAERHSSNPSADESEISLSQTLEALLRRNPARILETYYWSQEPGLLEVIRCLSAMPAETREAIEVFFTIAGHPETIIAQWESEGRLRLIPADKADNFARGDE